MDQIITVGRINITQAAITAISVIGLLGLVFGVLQRAVWKAWTDWKLSQLEANNLILKKQQELTDEVHRLKVGQDDLQSCIHQIPGHPEHSPSTKRQDDKPNQNDNNQNQ